MRYIRIRMGKGGDSGKDAITIADGNNMIFDHVSVSWGRDETFSINGEVSNVTISDSIIAQGLETHSCGGLMQTNTGGVSLFRNAYIDNKTRNPKVKGVNDFQNSKLLGVFITAPGSSDANSMNRRCLQLGRRWWLHCRRQRWRKVSLFKTNPLQPFHRVIKTNTSPSYANIINNYFISGPSTSVTAFTRGNANFRGYVKNNFYDSNKDGVLNGAALCESTTCYSNMAIQTTAFAYPAPAKLLSPADAVTHVSAKVGASIARDAVDAALVKQIASYGKSGALISDEATMGGVGTIEAGTAKKDTDGDGIPDEYETANGLNANDKSDGMKIGAGGYTNLEIYVNSLAPAVY